MMEIKMTLKPLAFAVRTSKPLPQPEIPTKASRIQSPSQAYLARLLDHDGLAHMSLSSLLYFALIGDNAAAS
jgi:hypothetical protein